MTSVSPILPGFVALLFALNLALLAFAAVLIVRSVAQRFGRAQPHPVPVRTRHQHRCRPVAN